MFSKLKTVIVKKSLNTKHEYSGAGREQVSGLYDIKKGTVLMKDGVGGNQSL